jgi:hypothetical protein
LWNGKLIVLFTANLSAMPQVTLSVPNEKLPILKEMLCALGIENKRVQSLPKSTYKKVSGSVKNSASYLFKKYFSWEYYRNELEFE